MSTTQEARDRHRQTLALEAMASYLKDLIPVMQTINQNLEDFVKIATPQQIECITPDADMANRRVWEPLPRRYREGDC